MEDRKGSEVKRVQDVGTMQFGRKNTTNHTLLHRWNTSYDKHFGSTFALDQYRSDTTI